MNKEEYYEVNPAQDMVFYGTFGLMCLTGIGFTIYGMIIDKVSLDLLCMGVLGATGGFVYSHLRKIKKEKRK